MRVVVTPDRKPRLLRWSLHWVQPPWNLVLQPTGYRLHHLMQPRLLPNGYRLYNTLTLQQHRRAPHEHHTITTQPP